MSKTHHPAVIARHLGSSTKVMSALLSFFAGNNISTCVRLCNFAGWQKQKSSQAADHLALDWHVCSTAGSVGTSPEVSLRNLDPLSQCPSSFFFTSAICLMAKDAASLLKKTLLTGASTAAAVRTHSRTQSQRA